jgi:hypothetical protein
MQSSRSYGRSFLINTLLRGDASRRDAIYMHLFERNDHISTSAFDIKAVVEDKRNDREILGWVSHATQMLDQLLQDIDLALKIEKWDRNILENTITLMNSLLNCFGALDDLRNAYSLKIPTQGKKSLENSADLVHSMNDAALTARTRRGVLMKHLKANGYSDITKKGSKTYDLKNGPGKRKIVKIPTATLRELFILNEAYGMREEIWRRVDNIVLQPHKAGKALNRSLLKCLTEIICMPAILFLVSITDLHDSSNFFKIQQRRPKGQMAFPNACFGIGY